MYVGEGGVEGDEMAKSLLDNKKSHDEWEYRTLVCKQKWVDKVIMMIYFYINVEIYFKYGMWFIIVVKLVMISFMNCNAIW